jgi:hypothetical protein
VKNLGDLVHFKAKTEKREIYVILKMRRGGKEMVLRGEKQNKM